MCNEKIVEVSEVEVSGSGNILLSGRNNHFGWNIMIKRRDTRSSKKV